MRRKVRFTIDGNNWKIGYIDQSKDAHTIVGASNKKYSLANEVKNYKYC